MHFKSQTKEASCRRRRSMTCIKLIQVSGRKGISLIRKTRIIRFKRQQTRSSNSCNSRYHRRLSLSRFLHTSGRLCSVSFTAIRLSSLGISCLNGSKSPKPASPTSNRHPATRRKGSSPGAQSAISNSWRHLRMPRPSSSRSRIRPKRSETRSKL